MSPNHPPSPPDLANDLGLLSLSPAPDRRTSPVGQDLRNRRLQIDKLTDDGSFTEAFNLELVQLRTSLDHYGEEDEQTISSLESLSSLNFKLGRHDEASKLLDRVIYVRTKTLGQAHPKTLSALASKVASLQVAGHIDQAERLGSDLLIKCTDSLGVEDPATLRAMANLATIYRLKGDYSNAETLSHLVLETRRKVLPPDDVDIVTAMVNLVGVYFSQNRWAEAATLLQSVLTIRRRDFGDGHDLTIKIMNLLEKAYEELERWNDLLQLRQLRLGVTKRKLGEGHMGTIEANMNVMYAYEKLEAWESAKRVIDDVIESLENVIPTGHPVVQSMREHREMLEDRSSKDKDDIKAAMKSVYSPLDVPGREIRLVSLKKGLFKDPLACELVVVALEQAPPFQALSYVWGPMHNDKDLALHGYKLKITDNLWNALVQLRSATADRLLWVDALAINQTDLQERSNQVRLMRDIYTKAASTLIWLGEEKDNSQLAMSFLKELEGSDSRVEIILKALQQGLDDPLFTAIEHLYTQREYWNRLWVVQEVICAQAATLHCGSHSVQYETLKELYVPLAEAMLQIKSAELRERFKSFEGFLHKIVVRGPAKVGKPSPSGTLERRPLLALLNGYRNAQCTDPRDRIYALLGISHESDSSHPGLQIDYSRPTAEVYRAAAQAVIDSSEKLNIICMNQKEITDPRTGRYHARHHPLPSWVPDWSTLIGSLPLASILTNAKAAGATKARAVFPPDGSKLTAKGVVIHKITYATKPISISNTHDHEILRTLMAWRLYVQACLGILPGTPSRSFEVLDPFYRLLVLDIHTYSHTIPMHMSWWEGWEHTLLATKSFDGVEISGMQNTYLQTVFDYCSGRCMIALNDPLSNSGTKVEGGIQLALCPQEVREGDLLVVLWGCDFPVVLREKAGEGERGHYKFVGEALVQGYMGGEAVEKEAREELVLTEFEIW